MNIKKIIRWIRIMIILKIFTSTLLLNDYYFIKFWIILYYIELSHKYIRINNKIKNDKEIY